MNFQRFEVFFHTNQMCFKAETSRREETLCIAIKANGAQSTLACDMAKRCCEVSRNVDLFALFHTRWGQVQPILSVFQDNEQ